MTVVQLHPQTSASKREESGRELIQPAWFWNLLGSISKIVHVRGLYILSGFGLLTFAGLSIFAAWHYHEKAFYAGAGGFMLAFVMLIAAFETSFLKWMEWVRGWIKEAGYWMIITPLALLFGLVLASTPNRYDEELE